MGIAWGAAAGLIIVTSLAAGCSSDDKPAPSTTRPTSVSTEFGGAKPSASGTDETTVVAPGDLTTGAQPNPEQYVRKFGQSRPFSGFTITVSVPKRFTTSDRASAPDSPALLFEIRVQNTGTKPVKLSDIKFVAFSGEDDKAEITDPTAKYGVPKKSVPPGGSLSYTMAFSEGPNLRLQVQVKDGFVDYSKDGALPRPG